MADWLQDIINALFMFVDGIVYGLIYIFYKLIICLANIQVFDSGTFADFATRIYAFLGIFMLFRLGFSVLQYLIDPDKATDKSVGAGKLMKNCIISLVLLVITPYAFSGLYKIQSLILSDNVLGNLVFGSDVVYSGDGKDGSHTLENMATDTQFLLFGAFFQVNTDVDTDIAKACENTSVLGSLSMAKEVGCTKLLTTELEKENVTINDFYYTGMGSDNEDKRHFDSFKKIVNIKYEDEYLFNYMPIISTVAGILVVYMLITFCIDIAIRVFYLAFLQLISPIPILSYMDPKQTFSSGIFSNWLKEVGKTYISVFIRLATIFLAMYFIQMVSNSIFGIGDNGLSYGDDNSGICEGCGEMNMWIYVFLIIGAFLFAKKVPQYIETIFGFKSDGGMFKSPWSKMKDSGLLTAGVGAIGGGIIGAGVTAAGAFGTAKSMANAQGIYGGKATLQGLRSAAGGLGSGLFRGGAMGARSKGEHIMRNASQSAGRTSRNMELRQNTNLADRVGARARLATGMQSKYEILENQAKGYDSFQNAVDRMEDRAKDQLGKKDDSWKALQAQRKVLDTRLENGLLTKEQYVQEINQIKNSEDLLVEKYIDNGGLTQPDGSVKTDSDLALMRKEVENINKDNNYGYDISDWAHMSAGYEEEVVNEETGKKEKVKTSAKDKAKAKAQAIRIGDDYKDARAIHEAQQSGLLQHDRKR